MKQKNLANIRFGRLIAVEMNRKDPRGDYWLCKCDCGNEKIIRSDALLNGRTRSCGCLLKESARARSTKHGKYKTKLYSVYYAMHHRCENRNDVSFSYYGGRKISVCDEWSNKQGFERFYSWALQNGYEEGLTLDRIDPNGNYEPSNCRWVSRIEQQQNIRRNVMVSCDGEKMTLRKASEKYGVKAKTIYNRIRSGWDDETAVKTPLQTKFINRRYR